MKSVRTFLVFPLIALMLASSSAFAGQQHSVPSSQLSATVADSVVQQDANRAAVHEALARPEVLSVADSIGLDLTRANAAVDTLSGTELDKAAAAAQQVNQQLVGGSSTVVISTTTIIIVLLLLILILVLK